MKLAIALAASLAIAGAAAAQPQPGPMHMRDPGPPPAMSGPAVSVPISFTAGMPTIEATVNGQGPFRLGFDTGAMGGVHISAAAAERAGLSPVGEALAGDPSGRNPQRIKVYGPAALALGGRTLTAPFAESPTLGGGKLDALDGIAGLGIFGGALVTIDYGRGVLSAGPGALPPPDGRTVFAYEGPIPRVPLEVEGRRLEAHLDTGNVRAGVILPADVAAQLAGHDKAVEAGVAHTISSAIPMFAVKLAGPAKVGETPLTATEAQYPSVAAIGNVGSLALQGLIVRVDTVNRRVQVIAPPAQRKS
jgi:hypothetical protein